MVAPSNTNLLVGAVGAAVFGYFWRWYCLNELQVYTPIEYHNDGPNECEVLGLEELKGGSEDLAIYKNGIVLIGAGWLHGTFLKGASSVPPGDIFSYDIGTKKVKKLEMKGFDANKKGFEPHGIYFSNTTQRLYVVSHTDEKSGTVIEIFDVVERPELHLVHRYQLFHTIYGNHAVNDVVEAATDGSSIYMTEWLTVPHAVGGMQHGPQTWYEPYLMPLHTYTPRWFHGLTRVFHCTVPKTKGTPPECQVVSSGFTGANGMTISDDRKTLFVVDPFPRTISVFRINPDWSLTYKSEIRPLTALDNIEWDAQRKVIMAGGISRITITFAKAFQTPLPPIPGSYLEIPWIGGPDGHAGKQSEPVVHDGSRMSMISAGVRWGKKLVIGTPLGKGLMVCTEK